jgi:cupin fold WbuC family metalloprotein
MPDSPAEVQLITSTLFEDLLEKARQSPRRRINHNFHAAASDNPHRFLNVFLQGSYVTPHRHLHPPKAESFLVLEGWMAAWIFEDDGTIRSTVLLGQGAPPESLPQGFKEARVCRGIDVPPGVWHTLSAMTPHAVCFEVKPGPWEPANDKEFAPWAPREGDPEAAGYLSRLTGLTPSE